MRGSGPRVEKEVSLQQKLLRASPWQPQEIGAIIARIRHRRESKLRGLALSQPHASSPTITPSSLKYL